MEAATLWCGGGCSPTGIHGTGGVGVVGRASTIEPEGRPLRPSTTKPPNAAAHARRPLKMASRPGWTVGANGRPSPGAISQKLSERSRTSTHVAMSSCVASGPGRMPLEKKRTKQ